MPLSKSRSEITADVEGIEYVTAAHEAETILAPLPAAEFPDYSAEEALWDAATGSTAKTSGSGGGGTSLRIFLAAPGDYATRDLTGLTVGRQYTITITPVSTGINRGVWAVGIDGIGEGSAVDINTSPDEFTYTFTATSTTETLKLRCTANGTYGASTNHSIYVGYDVEALYYEETQDSLPLEVIDAQVTLDDNRVPYAEAVLTCHLPDEEYLEQIDPREQLRLTLTATQEWSEPTKPDQERTFDLLLHEREVDNVAKTVRIIAVSDEAFLIDGANVIGTNEDPYGVSVQDAVEFVLDKFSLTLTEATDADIDSDALEATVTNLAETPIPDGGTIWTGSKPMSYPATSNPRNGGPVARMTDDTDSGVSALYIGNSSPYFSVTDETTYTITVNARANTNRDVTFGVRRDGNSDFAWGTTYVTLTTEWQLVTFTWTATASEQVYFAIRTEDAVNNAWIEACDLMWTEGSEEVEYFDGSVTDTALYEYAWTGTANDSTSTKTNLPHNGATVLEPGVGYYTYLRPLLDAGALRLFCDEDRAWRLVDPETYSVPGVVSVSEGTNALSGTDLISMQSRTDAGTPVYYTGVVIRYRWTDEDGAQQTAYDYAGTSTKVYLRTVERKFPGAGAAEALLARASGRGRVQELEALTDLNATPGMSLVSTLPGTPIQLGVVSKVTWIWSGESDYSGVMRIGSRGLTDTADEAWVVASGDWDTQTDDWDDYDAA